MKTILLRVSIFLLITIPSCTMKHAKRVQDELNWTAEYCNEELETIENSNPITSHSMTMVLLLP